MRVITATERHAGRMEKSGERGGMGREKEKRRAMTGYLKETKTHKQQQQQQKLIKAQGKYLSIEEKKQI
jgi:hypothetical protein